MQPFDLAADHAQWRSSRRLFSGRGTDSIGEIIRRRPREFTETRNRNLARPKGTVFPLLRIIPDTAK
jgi:hypothetical protein